MGLVSIITPTQAHNADHLLAAWASICDQPLPPGWEVEWVVQEDGPTPRVGAMLPDDPRIRYEAVGAQLGPAATRNLALLRSRGDVVAGLDHDDAYRPGGLRTLLTPLVEHDDVAWACGEPEVQLMAGEQWHKDPVFPAGRIPARAIADHYLATGDFPFFAAYVAYRRIPLVAHGGWPAAPRSEDAVLLAAFADRWDGWWVDDLIAIYRRWPSQRTQDPSRLSVRRGPHVRQMITGRRAATDRLNDR